MSQHYTDGTYWDQRKGFRSDYKVPLVLAAMKQAGVRLQDSTRILEVGCGNGSFLWPFSEALAQEGIRPHLEGIDIAENAIQEARGSCGANPPEFLCKTLDEHESKYDVALLVDVVEHVPCPVDFLNSLRRLAPLLFLHLPIEHSLLHLFAKRPTASYRRYRHIHFYSLETARILVEDAGWRIRGIRYSAADAATLTLPAPRWLQVGRYARYLAYNTAPRLTTICAGGSVTFICDNAEGQDSAIQAAGSLPS